MIQLLFILFFLAKAETTTSNTTCASAYCSNCDSTDNTICTACIDGYLLNRSNICLWLGDFHCAAYYYSLCQSCEDGYSLTTDHQCIECPDYNGCSTLKGDSCDSGCSVCSNSKTYFNETNNVCQNDDNFCGNYNSDGTCNYCLDFYYFNTTTLLCEKGNINHCIEYNDDETGCSYCENNYVYYDGECQTSPIENCKYTDTENIDICSECDDGYQKSEDKTMCFKCNVTNCDSCVDEDGSKCELCGSGYYLNDVLCSISSVENCATYKSNTNECSICDVEYYLSGNTCNPVDKVDYCASYSLTINECAICDDNYYLSGNTCTSVDSVDNCATYVTNINQCSTCNSGFYLNNQYACAELSSVDFCSTYSSTNDLCIGCVDGYGLVGASCDECTGTNCKSCDEDVSICDSCYTGHTLINGECIECEDSHCSSCGENGKCEICQDDYFINEDFTCSKCAYWCEESEGNTKCTHSSINCNVDYEENDNCEKFDSDGKTCIECASQIMPIENGKCYTYGKATGYDGIDYGCYTYNINYQKMTVIDVETFQPVDGVCENPYITEESSSIAASSTESSMESSTESSNEENNNGEDKNSTVIIIGTLLIALLLL